MLPISVTAQSVRPAASLYAVIIAASALLAGTSPA